jgi:hypothetical protein
LVGLHRTTVAAQLRQAGVKLRHQGVPDALLDEAIQLYGDGWSCQRLAERYGCDAETWVPQLTVGLDTEMGG